MEGRLSSIKKLQWTAQDSEDLGFHFFKVIRHDNHKEKVLIPPRFIKYMGENSRDSATLRGALGHYWRVSLSVEREGLFFSNGWETFYKENSLCRGDFLLFKHVGGKHFDVRIYGIDGLEKIRDPDVIRLSNEESDRKGEIHATDANGHKGKSHPLAAVVPSAVKHHQVNVVNVKLEVSQNNSEATSDAPSNVKQHQVGNFTFASPNTDRPPVLSTYKRKKDILKKYEADSITIGQQALGESSNPNTHQLKNKDEACVNQMVNENVKQENIAENVTNCIVNEQEITVENVTKFIAEKPEFAVENNNENNQSSQGIIAAPTYEEQQNAWIRSAAFSSTNPSYKCALTALNVNKFHLHIPREASHPGLFPDQVAMIVLRNSEQKVWIVKVEPTKRGYSLKKGWRQFVLENGLMEGDVCIFECIHQNEIMVHVFTCRL